MLKAQCTNTDINNTDYSTDPFLSGMGDMKKILKIAKLLKSFTKHKINLEKTINKRVRFHSGLQLKFYFLCLIKNPFLQTGGENPRFE